VSQLGLMFVAMGVGAFSAGIFHLYTHAFFKGLLFLGSGAVIHALSGEQDMRKMGGLRKELPVTYWTFLVGALAIAGVPLLSGFFSKDELLYRAYSSGHWYLWFFASLASLLTACYMFRIVFMTFHGERAPQAPTHLHDAPRPMAIALVVLAVGAVLAGYVGVPGVLGGQNRIERFLEPSFEVPATVSASGEGGAVLWSVIDVGEPDAAVAKAAADAADSAREHTLEGRLMLTSTLAAFAGIGLAWLFFLKRRDLAEAAARRSAACTTCCSGSTTWTRSTTPPSCSRSGSCRSRGCGRAWTSA
jgi:NADH-quinone oxidoreductase subunit L